MQTLSFPSSLQPESAMNTVENNAASTAPYAPNPSSVITNGAVSGILPQSESFAINYPGYPSSTSRAVDTLGGLDEIAKVRSSDSRQLELRFRPEDPYCHPALGEHRAFAGLLLKISKTRPVPNNAGKEQLSAELVARVNEAYHFEGMVDYQHVLAVHAAEAKRKKRHRVSYGEIDLEEEKDVMMLVPPFFSLKNMPEEIVLNQPSNLVSRLQKNAVEHRWEMDIEPCLAIAFNIEKVPERVNWEDHIPRGTTDWELQSAVSKLFDVRAIWPRMSIHEQLLDNGLPVTVHMLRRLLFRSGYYFSTGPFARFWIRKGYDPRKDPESRKFQKIDFRVPEQLRSDEETDAGSKKTWKSICQFQVFPWKNFTNLQFFELDDDFIQVEIQKPTDQTTCMPKTGWLSDYLLNTLRLRVKVRFLYICPKEGAKILLRSTCEKFERCKKLETLSRIRKPVTKHQHLNQGHPRFMLKKHLNQDSSMSTEVVFAETNSPEVQLLGQDGPSNCEIGNNREEEEEEEEEEDDEELDPYESPAMAGGDGCFSPTTGSYQTGDTIANDILQDLLGEFPLCGDGNDSRSNKDVQDLNLSDGEYQIYEQDSDDSDDDDDVS